MLIGIGGCVARFKAGRSLSPSAAIGGWSHGAETIQIRKSTPREVGSESEHARVTLRIRATLSAADRIGT